MDCKLPKNNKDLKDAISYKWDAINSNNEELSVYCINGFPHSIGGRLGINELYCCRRNEPLTIDNIMSFSGDSCKWDITLMSNNYYRNKWNEKSIEHNYVCSILRNNKKFYTMCSYNLDYLMAKANVLMHEIYEHPVNFHIIGYENEIIGRKIIWKQTPCTIEHYSMNNNLIIVPDSNNNFTDDFIKTNEFDTDLSFPEDLFSSSISWFR